MLRVKIKNSLISINRLAKSIGYLNFISKIKGNYQLRIQDDVLKRRILVIAPHFDDESLGCGGTLRKHLAHGSSVRVLFLCNGRMATNGLSAEKMASMRLLEAERALKELGVDDYRTLDFQDGQLTVKDVAFVIAEEICNYQPELIYLPSEIDDNRDHMEVADGAKLALQKLIKKELAYSKIRLCFYEVWLPLFPNLIVTIDVEKKYKLIGNYQSQIKDRSYDKAMLGLNSYRGYMSGAGQPAEAFFEISAENWLGRK